MINKRYKDIFEQYIYKGESTPLTIGTLVICALCFLLLIIATFSQITIVHPWFEFSPSFHKITKTLLYNPQIPIMIFTIYILGKYYSLLTFILYLLVGFFIWPIFVFGGGISYIQNYLFGYFIGFVFAIFITGTIISFNQSIKTRLLGALAGIISIHVCGFLYCFVLAILNIIDFNIIIPIANAVSANKIIYDIIFTCGLLLIAPYIKNVLWICMKPKVSNNKKKSKNPRKRRQVVGDDIN